MERLLYTIGHSNHKQEVFLRLLQENSIAVLVDTRSQPYSKYAPQFNPHELETALKVLGITYHFLGRELGGRPEEPELYDSAGHARYDQIAQTHRFMEGMATLESLTQGEAVAIFCSEENPSACHRRLLIGKIWGERGNRLLHLRGKGSIQTEEELVAEEENRRNPGGQQTLFEENEVHAWRSIPSVSPKRPPNSFSRS